MYFINVIFDLVVWAFDFLCINYRRGTYVTCVTNRSSIYDILVHSKLIAESNFVQNRKHLILSIGA